MIDPEKVGMEFPPINGPTDLPELRNWLMRFFHDVRADRELGEDAAHALFALPTAQLWWVESEACALVAEAAPTLPGDVPLDMQSLPTPCGLAVFAEDIPGTDSDPNVPGKVIWVSAVMWTPSILPPVLGVKREGLSLFLFSRFPMDERGTLMAYVGRTDWVNGWRIEQPIVDNPHGMVPTTLASMAEDRRLVQSLWTLANTPVVTHVFDHYPPRFIRRRAEREGTNPIVRVMTMRGPSGNSTLVGSPGTTEWKHQWIVRPHWVWQPYGKGRTQRRLILRGPYRKGPEDAPLLGGERVWRVAPPPPERNN